jgi:hypothetical protein
VIEWLREYFRRRAIEATVIDPNSKCPACGNYSGKLKCVTVNVTEKNSTNKNDAIMIEHTCLICGARVYEPTVLKSENLIHPSVAGARDSAL